MLRSGRHLIGTTLIISHTGMSIVLIIFSVLEIFATKLLDEHLIDLYHLLDLSNFLKLVVVNIKLLAVED